MVARSALIYICTCIGRGRVARWHIFEPKKSRFGLILEGFAMEDVGILYGHLVYLQLFWYVLWLFGIFFPVLVCCTKKNLATLGRGHLDRQE
jgi:hypothetical protein